MGGIPLLAEDVRNGALAFHLARYAAKMVHLALAENATEGATLEVAKGSL